MTIEFLSGAQLEEVLAGAGKSLVEEHAAKLRAAGEPEPLVEVKAKAKAAGDLQGTFEIIAGRIAGFKASVLKSMGELQLKLMDAYEALFRGEKPDMESFERTLREMDELMNTLGADSGETVDKMPAPPEATKAPAPAAYPPIEPPPGERPGFKPDGEPVPRKIVDGKPEKLDKNNLTAEQRRFFEEWRKNAGGKKASDADLERMRYERNRVGRRNRGLPDRPSQGEYETRVSKSQIRDNRLKGTAESDALRPAVSNFLGRELVSGDSPRSFKTEVPGAGVNGEAITIRPDGMTVTADGTPDPSGIVQEHKLWRGREDGVFGETDQTRAERKYATDAGGKHVVSMSAEVPAELTGTPPRPRSDAALGKNSIVLFVDRVKAVTHRWNASKGGWDPIVPR